MLAAYKYTVIAMLQKKKGRDIEVLKEQKIICDSKEDALKTLDRIQKQMTGDFSDENQMKKDFDSLKEKVDN